jgi:hypothetical protein
MYWTELYNRVRVGVIVLDVLLASAVLGLLVWAAYCDHTGDGKKRR